MRAKATVLRSGPEVDAVWTTHQHSPQPRGTTSRLKAPGERWMRQPTSRREPLGAHHLALIKLQVLEIDWLELARSGHRRASLTADRLGHGGCPETRDARVGTGLAGIALQPGCQHVLALLSSPCPQRSAMSSPYLPLSKNAASPAERSCDGHSRSCSMALAPCAVVRSGSTSPWSVFAAGAMAGCERVHSGLAPAEQARLLARFHVRHGGRAHAQWSSRFCELWLAMPGWRWLGRIRPATGGDSGARVGLCPGLSASSGPICKSGCGPRRLATLAGRTDMPRREPCRSLPRSGETWHPVAKSYRGML